MSQKSLARKHRKAGSPTDLPDAPVALVVGKSLARKIFEIAIIVGMLLAAVTILMLHENRPRQRDSTSVAPEDPVGETASIPPPIAEPEKVSRTTHPRVETPPDSKLKSVRNAPRIVVDEPPAERPPEPAPRVPDEAQIAAQVDAQYPMPDIPPLMDVVGDWKNVPQSAFPEQVTTDVPVDFEVISDGDVVGRTRMPAGSLVVPTGLDGTVLTVSTSKEGMVTATVDVDQTDFKQRVQDAYESFIKMRTDQVIARRTSERNRLLKAFAHEEQLSTYNRGDDPRFEAVKLSLQRGDAGFFELEAASKWRWGGKESIAGVEYETAYAIMVSESAFGIAEREIKALIRDGEVVKWIDVASGEQL